jgi:hypothetical protein
MMTRTKVLVIVVLVALCLAAALFVVRGYLDSFQPQAWDRTYGGTDSDIAYALVQNADGGYVLAGSTGNDFWFVRTDVEGTMLWNHTYAGAHNDWAKALVQASDGGYAIAGYTDSYGAGGWDAWLVKTDSDGAVQLNMTYGGKYGDVANALVRTSDGGYAMAGYTYSYGDFKGDSWLVKTDANGILQWNKTYGGTQYDGADALVETADGGYALAGSTSSYGAGAVDFWLVKTDADGSCMWNNTYGGTDDDYAYGLVQAVDGGYVLAGYTYSFGAGGWDAWLVKTDADGTMQWNKTYGGTNWDLASALVQTADGGYAFAGYTYSYGGGNSDMWLVNIDAEGNVRWNSTYGGTGYENAEALVQTSDGGYAVAGFKGSETQSNYDFWLVKTDASGVVPEFLSPMIFAVFITVASSAVVLTKRKLLGKQRKPR